MFETQIKRALTQSVPRQINKGVIHLVPLQFRLDWGMTFPALLKESKALESQRKRNVNSSGGAALPLEGGGRGCRGSSRLFLDPKPAKTLQSDAFATQVKATAWKIWKGIQFATSTQLSFLLLFCSERQIMWREQTSHFEANICTTLWNWNLVIGFLF